MCESSNKNQFSYVSLARCGERMDSVSIGYNRYCFVRKCVAEQVRIIFGHCHYKFSLGVGCQFLFLYTHGSIVILGQSAQLRFCRQTVEMNIH